MLLGTSLGATAQPRPKCPEERAQAENLYLEGLFDDAIALLQECLDREELFVAEATQVYRLLILAHLNQEETDAARIAAERLLAVAPAYTPDPVQDTPSYTSFVNRVREERTPPEPVVEEEPLVEEEPGVEEPAAETLADDAPPTDDMPSDDAPPSVVEKPAVEQPPVAPDLRLPDQSTGAFRVPAKWFVITGGAFVVFTAAVLVFGGGNSGDASSPTTTPR